MFWRVKEIKKKNEKRIIIWNGVLEYTTRCEYFFFFLSNVMFIIFSQCILNGELYKWFIKVKSIKYREHKFFFFFWERVLTYDVCSW